MANNTCNVASKFSSLDLATAEQYKEMIGDFFASQKDKWININISKGVKQLDAEDIFSSAITYMLEPKTYQNYLKLGNSGGSIYKFDPNASGINKLPCIAIIFSKVIKTKKYHFYRGCKRFANAIKSYIHMLKSGLDLSEYVSVDRLTKETYKKHLLKNGKKHDESIQDWLSDNNSAYLNKGFSVLPKNMDQMSFDLKEKQMALNPENQLIAAEEKSSAPSSDNVIIFTNKNIIKQSYFEAA